MFQVLITTSKRKALIRSGEGGSPTQAPSTYLQIHTFFTSLPRSLHILLRISNFFFHNIQIAAYSSTPFFLLNSDLLHIFSKLPPSLNHESLLLRDASQVCFLLFLFLIVFAPFPAFLLFSFRIEFSCN